MSSAGNFIFKGFPKETIALGSFVPDLTCPDQDATEPPVLSQGEFYNLDDLKPRTFYENGDGTSFYSHFTKFLSLSRSRERDGASDLSAARGRIYRLNQPEAVFRRLCGDESVQRWLERKIKQKRKVYFITGIRTYFDTTYTHGGQQISTISAKAQVPITELATATPIGDTLDISLGGQHQHSTGNYGTSYIPGEYVFDICYRMVVFKFAFYGSSAIGTANGELRSNFWKPVTGSRGKNEEGFEVVEASFDEVTPGQVKEVPYRFKDA